MPELVRARITAPAEEVPALWDRDVWVVAGSLEGKRGQKVGIYENDGPDQMPADALPAAYLEYAGQGA